MKRIIWGIFSGLLVAALIMPQALFAGTLLQISAEAGISIWLNKDFIGKTTKEQNGLVIADLAPGRYSIRAALQGYRPVETVLTIENDQTIEWRIRLTKPAMKVDDTIKRIDSSMIKAKPMGTVVLHSIPLDAEIFFDGKPLGNGDKKLSYVPAADHAVRFVFQKQELTENFSLQPDESIHLTADFIKKEIVKSAVETDTKRGPAVIKMQTAKKRKPAMFPHRKHQALFGCENCHHGRDSEGQQVPYTAGMDIQHCVTCHNPRMGNNKLDSLMLAAHAMCKGCHKKIVAESGTAGPIGKCIGCHNVTKNE